MKKKFQSRLSINLNPARVVSSLQSKQAAIWAMKMALENLQCDLLTQDVERFISVTGPYLRWTPAAFQRFFNYYDCPEEQLASFSQLSPNDAWERLTEDLDYEAQQAFRAFRKFYRGILSRVLKGSLKVLEQEVAGCCDPVMENVLMLQHLIGMSEAECKFLHLIACASIHSTVRSIMSATRVDNLADAAPIIAMLIGEDDAKVVEAMKADGLLSQLGLFVQDKSPSCLHEAVQLAEWCYRSFAEPHASTAEMMGKFIEAVPSTELADNDFPHLAADLTALTQYLNGVREKGTQGINILIYGKPGTGKTEFSKVLAKQLGAHLYAVPDRYSDGVPILKGERLKFLQMSERFLSRRKGALILFDEIDDVFPENGLHEGYTPRKRYATSGKAWMNRTLEMNRVPVIWISNHAEHD